ncbi:MAG: A/G-specific adenine glycosylase [Candidatus Thiodiazotropha sp. (ex Monitilora ramsayi)]|nr:A/G-specific adenine glycosylase [Candidatus Thiodiazotropha sp. (ex Monitilora ramsayi)]
MQADSFARRVLGWFEQYGRKDLPWQHPRDPYRVWVSEIMLQQTQVATVIPYFERFLGAFPDLDTLANASLDDVLHHWSGLGYYARARNLHRCAISIAEDFDSQFPCDQTTLESLPGIGRSTAGAIRSLACGQPAAILDGNVKRVLARHYAIEGWPGKSRVQKRLWDISERLTPEKQCAEYNQAMMDIGSMVCSRGRPACHQCPLQATCLAFAQGNPTAYPQSKPRRELPVKQACMVIVLNDRGEVLLEQRPPSGIWGGLWSLPECPPDIPLNRWCSRYLSVEVDRQQLMSERRHSFTHFHLDITPVRVRIKNPRYSLMDEGNRVWYNLTQPDSRGLAAPVKRILQELEIDDETTWETS